MMHKKVVGRLVALVISSVFVVAGCSDDSGGGSKGVEGTLKSYNAAGERAADIACECYAEDLGHSSKEACVAASFEPLELSQCEKQAAGCDTSNYTKMLDCRKSALSAFGTCISACGTEGNEVDYDSCVAQRDTALAACEDHRSETLDEAFAACANGEVPACFFGDGDNGSGNSDTGNNRTQDASDNTDGGGSVDDTDVAEEDTWTTPEDTGSGSVDTGSGSEDTGSGGDPNDPRIDQAISDLISAEYAFATQICDCYESAFDSRQVCMDQNQVDREVSSCRRQAIACDIPSFVSQYECFAQAASDASSCLSSCPEEQAEIDACFEDYSADFDTCRSQYYSSEITDGLMACEDDQTPTCN